MRKKNEHHLQYPGNKILIAAILTWVGILYFTLVINANINQASRQKQIISLSDHMIVFQNELADLLETGINLISGYEAYIKVHGTEDTEKSEAFLDQLMKRQSEYIRNIGIIKDTTIIYNYPMEENEASIGKDLAKIEEQKTTVLKVKEELVPAFQGPVELVQGGIGYILRVPLLDQKGEYWGQASIVLRAERIHKRILELARENDMEVLIQNVDHETIIGNDEILTDEARKFSTTLYNDWVIYATPEDGWKTDPSTNRMIYLIGVLVATIMATVIYVILRSTYRLRYDMFHDRLTDLYNRHYLDKVQKSVIADSNLYKKVFGIMHIDLDQFKSINDIHGHEKGDYVLSEMGKILKIVARREDLIFRIGGDEFLVVTVDVQSKDQLDRMRKRYYEDIRNMAQFDEYLSMTNPSIGIALFKEDGYDFDQVMKVADSDMYNEKSEHKKNRSN